MKVSPAEVIRRKLSEFDRNVIRTTLYLRNMVLRQLPCVIEILEELNQNNFNLRYALNDRIDLYFWQISVTEERVLIRIPERYGIKDTAWASKDFPLPDSEIIEVKTLDSLPKSYLNILIQDAYLKAHQYVSNPTFGYDFKLVNSKSTPKKIAGKKL